MSPPQISADSRTTEIYLHIRCLVSYWCSDRWLAILKHELKHCFIWLQVAGEKRFACSTCNRLCSSKNYLRRHENWHHGIYPYSCPYCSKGFMASTNLKAHLAIHTGVKPYQCDLCDQQFNWKDSLVQHKHSKHVNALSWIYVGNWPLYI